MTARLSPRLLRPATVVLTFIAALAVFWLLSRDSGAPAGGAEARREAALPVPTPGESTDARIRDLQRLAAAAPNDARGPTQLGFAYLQKVRETGDAAFYGKAQGVIGDALRLAPRDPAALTAAGTLALARHDFRGALVLGRRARAAAPDSLQSAPVLVDANVELGRYRDAGRVLQTFVDEKPTLAAYARVSYYKELHGDLPGALDAMRLAVSSGGDTAENVAYVQTLLGNLDLQTGRVGAADAAYRAALARFRGYPPAAAGIAAVAAARGRLAEAARGYRDVVSRLPLPQYVFALGEVELAAGRGSQARQDLALVGAEERLLRANGVNVDVDLALFEANHGSSARAVTLARRAWASSPSVRSADALGWALTRAGHPRGGLAWARRSLVLGSRDPSFLHHAGMSALAAGRRDLARTWLARSLADNPRWSPLYAPQARRALARIGG